MHAETNYLSKIIKIAFAVTYLPSREPIPDADISRHTKENFISMTFALPLKVATQQTVGIPLLL